MSDEFGYQVQSTMYEEEASDRGMEDLEFTMTVPSTKKGIEIDN
ncbi:hypothetical protein C943_01559 [Mariniradius saccharolyticus AK6]|uniref:Uncharacterized protein n=1 Tax=Mariniradius saccharolyticus AK6 TaxID=1239962 RepID=M7Y4X2_9BACT|nr:hypothetical protein C943_01559 [Mariniradius saccharolyticus AK6]